MAGRPVGQRLVLHGHGIRERQLRGPLGLGEAPCTAIVLVRRYRCQACGAVSTVAPRSMVRGRLFSVSAIGLALALWALSRLPLASVRRLISPWRVVGSTAGDTWVTVRRWAGAVRRGALFPCVRAVPPDWSLRQVAERAATTLAAMAVAPRDGPLEAQVFLGAARAS